MDEVPYLKLAAVANEGGGLSLFALNRSLDQALDLRVVAHGFTGLAAAEALTLHDDDLDAFNTRDAPNRLEREGWTMMSRWTGMPCERPCRRPPGTSSV
ncbi:MAG: hypothetical protein HC871_08145 [Rhizobiales bacterium]|nr:hypothetical protein [Hyphomicrobiales bacterium]